MPIGHKCLIKQGAFMKRTAFVLVLCTLAGMAYAQSPITLDEAIRTAGQEIGQRLPSGIKVVVLNFNSPSERFTNYVVDELTGVIVNNGKLTAVDRQNLALIQQEMNFQLSGEVSDESAQAIGQKLGAQSIISGSIDDLGNFYRIRFRAIEVISAAIQTQPTYNVRKDNQIAVLMRRCSFSATIKRWKHPSTSMSPFAPAPAITATSIPSRSAPATPGLTCSSTPSLPVLKTSLPDSPSRLFPPCTLEAAPPPSWGPQA
jgi:TolB-like protein